ncbi:ABC transporter permease [Cohnella sp. LGH]|uniref:ABC transporter permease n=1 Tax=Cohnella sp. LGH TaxID=1619153 RepID=UPI001ADAF7D1|nr:ABC transporter permease [Cohnella sp. LGH]QTH40088.1 ABC transporter permease [Cohnella sp. LGH]
MRRLIVRKLLEALVTLLGATLILFVLVRLAPGDPVKLLLGSGTDVALSDTQLLDRKSAQLREELGLNENVAAQYASWLKRLLQADLGSSIYTGRAVGGELAERLAATFALSVSALAVQVGLGMFLGTASALKAGKLADNVIRLACVSLASTPAFVIGLALLSLFAVTLGAYEISSEASPGRLWLPAATLGLLGAAQFARFVRAQLLSELGRTYVLSALARGLDRRHVVRHALRNALLSLVTMIALSLTALIGGAVVIESVFSWPGIGKYALDGIMLKDYPVIQGYAIVMISLVVLIHFVVEVVYGFLDPRIAGKDKAEAL